MRPLSAVWQPVRDWPPGVEDPLQGLEPCVCLEPGLAFASIDRELGMDPSSLGEATLRRCRACGRIWLLLRVEHEGFTKSGRWHRAVLDDEHRQVAIEASMAVNLLSDIPWHVSGGDYFDGRSQICTPPVFLDVAGDGRSCRPLYLQVMPA